MHTAIIAPRLWLREQKKDIFYFPVHLGYKSPQRPMGILVIRTDRGKNIMWLRYFLMELYGQYFFPTISSSSHCDCDDCLYSADHMTRAQSPPGAWCRSHCICIMECNVGCLAARGNISYSTNCIK